MQRSTGGPRCGLRIVVGIARAYQPEDRATRKSASGSRVNPQWGEVAVADVKTSAIRAWVAKLATDSVGVPGIENAFGRPGSPQVTPTMRGSHWPARTAFAASYSSRAWRDLRPG
jgi:hypothetical protein